MLDFLTAISNHYKRTDEAVKRKRGAERKKYTTIGELYKSEMALVKLFGAQTWCTSSKMLGHLYIIVLFVLSKLFLLLYGQFRFVAIELDSDRSRQNIEMYIKVCYMFLLATQVAVMMTTFRYSQFFHIILNKQFQRSYLKSYQQTRKYRSYVNRVKLFLLFISISSACSVRIRSSAKTPLKSLYDLHDIESFFSSHDYSLPNTNATTGRSTTRNTFIWAHFYVYQTVQNITILTTEYLYANLMIFQNYGHQIMVLMIVAALNDIVLFSCHFDQLAFEAQPVSKWIESYGRTLFWGKIQDVELSSTLVQDGGFRRLEGSRRPPKEHPEVHLAIRRRPLFTTKVLIQVRHLLMLLKQVNGLEYLVVFLFDVSRQTYCMGLIYAHLKGRLNYRTLAVLLIEYARILAATSFLRLAYFWLHDSMESLKRFVDEIKLIESTQKRQILDQSNRVIILRLTDEILKLWPTDWLKADLKSILTSQIYILTVVVTLEQLAELGIERKGHVGN